MAIACQGFTFEWGDATLSQVQSLDVDLFQGELPVGRSVSWTPAIGVVRLFTFSSSGLATSEYGRRKRLRIRAPLNTNGTNIVTLFESDCIYNGFNMSAQANGVVRFAYEFAVQDTLNAPTFP